MRLATRIWSIAGAALVSAGLITATPVAAASLDTQSQAVQLAAFDPNNWADVLQLALTNATDIGDHYFPVPSPDLQQLIVNVPAYLEGTRNIETDFTAAYNAALDPFQPVNPEPYIYPSLDTTPSTIGISALGTHLFDIDLPGKADLLNILTNGLSFDIGICPLCVPVNIDVLSLLLGSTLASEVKPYLDFTGSPLSGILWGDVGTTLGPAVQLSNDITAISDALSGPTPDYTTALQELLDAPANLTNAYLNGYGDIGLSTLLTDFGIPVPPSAGDLELDLGGLLSPGGSLINGIGFSETFGDCSIGCADFEVPTTAVGPIGSMIEMSQAIAEAIGWSGVGNPLETLLSMF